MTAKAIPALSLAGALAVLTAFAIAETCPAIALPISVKDIGALLLFVVMVSLSSWLDNLTVVACVVTTPIALFSCESALPDFR